MEMEDMEMRVDSKELGFGEALVFLRYERRVKRASWSNRYIVLEESRAVNGTHVGNFWLKDASAVHTILHTKDTIIEVSDENIISEWNPIIDDLLALDWELVEDDE
jgi:hypothetical protein